MGGGDLKVDGNNPPGGRERVESTDSTAAHSPFPCLPVCRQTEGSLRPRPAQRLACTHLHVLAHDVAQQHGAVAKRICWVLRQEGEGSRQRGRCPRATDRTPVTQMAARWWLPRGRREYLSLGSPDLPVGAPGIVTRATGRGREAARTSAQRRAEASQGTSGQTPKAQP
jgi:hypothetical protein